MGTALAAGLLVVGAMAGVLVTDIGRASPLPDSKTPTLRGVCNGAPAVSGVPGFATTTQALAPVVWVQAGHVAPREPGYAAQTGASSGPFGSETGFTSRVAARLTARLRRAGVDARRVPGRVDPLGAGGATFISLHHDVPEGAAQIGYAIAGTSENYYHGEGVGTPSPTPYPDSAPHRRATAVSAPVERRSRALAGRLAARYGAAFAPANGARSRFAGVQSPSSNPRLMHYYGFFRTRARARVILEAGAGGTDDRLLARTDLIARAVSDAVLADLRARGELGGR